jgi:hypothetical protein
MATKSTKSAKSRTQQLAGVGPALAAGPQGNDAFQSGDERRSDQACHSERSEESMATTAARMAGFFAPLRMTGLGSFAFLVHLVSNNSGGSIHAEF